MTEHARARAAERYGLDLSWSDIDDLAQRLERGEGVLAEKRPGNTEVRLILVRQLIIRLLWYPTGKTIVTFLPRRNERNHHIRIDDKLQKGSARALRDKAAEQEW